MLNSYFITYDYASLKRGGIFSKLGRHRHTQACPTIPSRSRNRAILNCAILSIVSQLVSIDRKVVSDSEITVSCNLHFCFSVFNAFPIMFNAQSVRSKLISSAPINTAFWSCCLLCFSHLLRFRMIITFVALIYSFYFSPTYHTADADQNSAFNFLGTSLWKQLQASICMLHCIFAILCCTTYARNPSTVTCPPCCVRRCVIGSDSCLKNGIKRALVTPSAQLGSHRRQCCNTPVFSFIWLATLLTAPWWPLKPPAWLGENNSTDSGNRP